VGCALLGKNIAGEMVAPHQQRHFHFQFGPGRARPEHDVIGSPVFEIGSEIYGEIVPEIAEPEPRCVEQMRAEIVQHAGAMIAPFGIAHQTRRAVAVEHAAMIDLSEMTGSDQVAHGDVVRFETVIVGGVEHHVFRSCQVLQRFDLGILGRPHGFFHQGMFAVLQEIGEDLYLGTVGKTAQGRVVIGKRHVRDVAEVRFRILRVNSCDKIRAGEFLALVTLHPKTDDDNPQPTSSLSLRPTCKPIRTRQA